MTLTGLFVPLITPYAADGTLALDALGNLARQLLADGATGLVALGTTGEPESLTPPERRAVVEVAARACREYSAPLVVGGADPALLARDEVVAALSLVPPFVRPGEAGVLAHFTRLAATSPVPLLVYHVPYRTGQTLTADTLHRLAQIPGVAGIKYAGGGIDEQTMLFLGQDHPGFAVLGGDDLFVSPLLALGAQGAILASAHLATRRFADLIARWHTGDVQEARTLGHRLGQLSHAVFAEPNPTVIKGVLHAHGRIPAPDVRLPLLPAGAAAVEAAMDRLDALADDGAVVRAS
ncbi:dihydrodipicolinate synthetase [Kribbella flavida DSM 17836]|uniref:Dihydrodipicolinate synthetase n=1 Tax=Kribbella flavida (strain DSM 17836 / JCM 10339 / NBRC 14399) TaxID=479435 RepID=D2PLV8_KRIFD|nr:dihydrodipicolinate synthase family protein [Kribbella flavida]ADB32538.1 dihydrodipicolinate synthetase [Kribbella flavida DSM 17836]